MPPDERQGELTLPAPPATGDVPLVPARMLNEFVYCPRLAYLEWAEQEWAESGDTAEGRRVHVRVDADGPPLAAPDALPEDGDTLVTRSVTLSSERLGLIAKIDLVEAGEGGVTVVDYKKGKRPHVAAGAWEPERVQLCAQALVLEENGYAVHEAALWFAGSRERVRIALDDELRAATIKAIGELRLSVAAGRAPPPLENSPKCVRCSLAGICLPDEVNFFNRQDPPRPLAPGHDPALPLYVQTPGARISKRGDTLVVKTDEGEREIPFIDVSHLGLFGPVSLSTPALHELMRRDVPVTWLSSGGWLLGHTVGTGHRNVEIRTAQYARSFDDAFCLRFARGLVAAKIRNARTLLRRNWKRGDARAAGPDGEYPEAPEEPDDRPADDRAADARAVALEALKQAARRAEEAHGLAELLGREGDAAAVYFRHFEAMLGSRGAPALPVFRFERRNRRPPADPVNALLSLAYAMTARLLTGTLSAIGLDPYRGFYHRPRYGRPALALDLMEPLRPVLADSVVVQTINNGEIAAADFVTTGGACALVPAGRRRFVAAFERRLEQETTHPLFGYRMSLRRLVEVQARLLSRHLKGEIPDYPHYEPR